MKKSILNVIAALFISSLAFANTNEIKTTSKLKFDEIEIADKSVDDDTLYWCVAYYSESFYNELDGSTTTKTYYSCVKVTL
tara:strand:- start:24 stop:266 length:243 start_codon:yes stop_codon:yes gene_type:complete